MSFSQQSTMLSTWESARQIADSTNSGTIVFISLSRIRWCNTACCGSGDIYVTVKGVKRSGKVSRATIGRRLPWFRHPPINAPKQLSPNLDRTDLLLALHYLHKCNRRATCMLPRIPACAGEEMPLTCRVVTITSDSTLLKDWNVLFERMHF